MKLKLGLDFGDSSKSNLSFIITNSFFFPLSLYQIVGLVLILQVTY